MSPTITFDISGHGYGHLAQIAPLVRLAIDRAGSESVIVRSRHDHELTQHILGVSGLRRASPPPDPGLVMRNPVQVDVEATLRCYRDLHEAFPRILEREARRLERLGTDLLVSDVGHVGPAAAARAGIPAFALCSLHWEEIVAAFLPDTSEVRRIRAGILEAYEMAQAFLLAAPRRSVPRLSRVVSIGPMVRGRGRDMRHDLLGRTDAAPDTRFCYVTFGGIGGNPPALKLPDRDGWIWITAGFTPRDTAASSVIPARELAGLDALDLIATCDLVLTKTGYGTFTECVAHGTPCAFLSRPDWPEAPDLEDWITTLGIGTPVTPRMLADGTWLDRALRPGRGRRQMDMFTGATDAFGILSQACGLPSS